MEVPGTRFKLTKKRLILGAIGVVLLFLIASFIASYFKYKTDGPITEQPVSTYDEDAFKRLHEELTKDKPKGKEQKELLAEIVKDSERQKKITPASRRTTEDIYSKGTFDTLAVNCGILLEKYKELVIKYNELEKQVANKKQPTARRASNPSSGYTSRGNSGQTSANGFDYTRYLSRSGQNELTNESSGFSDEPHTWATLSISQPQKVFDQSVVTFDVAEAFVLDGQTIPTSAKVEGVAQVNRGRARIFVRFNRLYTYDQIINIEGEAFSLDRSRGINVFLQGESSVAEGFKREASDLVGLIDPSRTNIARSLIQDTDVGREVFGFMDAGTMILANIRRR